MRPVILVTGRNGQVGHALIPALSALGEVVALDRSGCDLSDPDSIRRAVAAANPALIVNAGAYTAVDRAETDRDAAFAVNADAPGQLAELARERGAGLIHFSTDYVFDGRKPAPYAESDAPNPLSVYGASKLAGEDAVRAAAPRHIILRTSWVFASHGANFLKTMLRLASEREQLNVVADQVGSPTSAALVANVTATVARLLMADKAATGTYHLAASGETSWHGYALFMIEKARDMGFPIRTAQVNPITTAEWPTPARRPANSRLDTARLQAGFPIALPPWQDGVVAVLESLSRT